MCLIGAPNFKEINLGYFLAQSYCFRSVQKEEKCEENWAIFRNVYFANYCVAQNFDGGKV